MAVKPFPTGLPSGVHLDDLKDQAKTLLKAVGAGEPFALERTKPYFDDASSLTLQRAQLVIAREHGFISWRKMKSFVEARDEMLANPLPDGGRPEAKDQVERRLGLARRMASALLEILKPDRSTRYCSFCFKSQHDAFKFIAGTGVFICDACVRLCSRIVADDTTAGMGGGDEAALQCSFCRKRAREVRTFIQSSADNICNECVELCVEIIEQGAKTSRPQDLDDMIARGREAVSGGADERTVLQLSGLLTSRMAQSDTPQEVKAYFDEAFDHLDGLIREERRLDRTTPSAFTARAHIFGGTIQLLKTGGHLSPDQMRRVSELLDEADERFSDVAGADIVTSDLRGLLADDSR